MCCEEHHICLSCNQLLASHVDRCAAAATREPGTELGIVGMHAADSWCPEAEWIVEQFLHDVDDGCCPHCSRHDDDDDEGEGDFSSPFGDAVVDHHVVHPPMLLASAAAVRNNGKGAGDDGLQGGAVSPTSDDDDDNEGEKVARRGWRLRVRKMMGSKRDGDGAADKADGRDTAKKRSSFGAVRFPYRVLE